MWSANMSDSRSSGRGPRTYCLQPNLTHSSPRPASAHCTQIDASSLKTGSLSATPLLKRGRMRRGNFIAIGSAAIVRPLPMYSSRNRRRDKTIKLWDATSGALNRSFEAHSGARLVSGILARQHPDISFGTDNTPGGVSYALKLCDSSKCVRFRRDLTPAGRLKANP
jgi:hypothetical protein